ERRDRLREGARRGSRGARRLPARRLPRRRVLDRGDPLHGRLRLRRHRGRAALQRPRHGRADHPGRGPAGAGGRHPHHRRAPHRRGGRRDGHAHGGDDLLEPRRALRRRPLRRRPRLRRGSGPDHPRPHPRQRSRLDRRGGRPRPRQDLPGRPVVDRRAHRDDHRRVPRLRLRHRRHGGHRGPCELQRPRRPAGRAHPGDDRPAGVRRARRLPRRPGRGGRRLRRRRHRRLRVRAHPAGPRRRPCGRALGAGRPDGRPRRRRPAWL
ncbi:MAG: Tryptophan synthase alpha chain, partial [uncultured Nocardioides sp.]